jgi:hypothetical protein
LDFFGFAINEKGKAATERVFIPFLLT